MMGKCKNCEYCLKTRTNVREIPKAPEEKEITRGHWFWKETIKEYDAIEYMRYSIAMQYYYEDMKRVHLCALYPKHVWYPADHGCGQYKLKNGIILE